MPCGRWRQLLREAGGPDLLVEIAGHAPHLAIGVRQFCEGRERRFLARLKAGVSTPRI
jgi:hypothetical protein